MRIVLLWVGAAATFLSPSVARSASGEEPLVTDRPDFTESAETVAPGRVQLESGYTFTDQDDGELHAFGELLVRLGLGRRVELRLGLNSYLRTELQEAGLSGVEDGSVGVKIKLRDAGDGVLRPQVAVILATTLPTGTSEYREPHFQPASVLALAWTLSPRLGLGANLGYRYGSEEGERFGEVSGSLALGYALGERLSGYVEYFGVDPQGRGGPDTHYLNAGLTCLLSDDTQLDIRAGRGLNSAAADLFVGVGAAFRW